MSNDLLMQQDVVAALAAERTIVAGTVGVEVHHGVVKLAGCVRDDAARDNSMRAAQKVDGVTSVVMDVDVIGADGIHRSAAGPAAAV